MPTMPDFSSRQNNLGSHRKNAEENQTHDSKIKAEKKSKQNAPPAWQQLLKNFAEAWYG